MFFVIILVLIIVCNVRHHITFLLVVYCLYSLLRYTPLVFIIHFCSVNCLCLPFVDQFHCGFPNPTPYCRLSSPTGLLSLSSGLPFLGPSPGRVFFRFSTRPTDPSSGHPFAGVALGIYIVKCPLWIWKRYIPLFIDLLISKNFSSMVFSCATHILRVIVCQSIRLYNSL